MRAFTCGNCGQLVFFENTMCLRCGKELGLRPSTLELVVLEPDGGLRRCANARIANCNWLLEAGEDEALCRSCRLTRTRPADDDLEGLEAFADTEGAKRRLIFQLLDLGLPVDGDRLRFDLLSSSRGPVTTGHADGLITIDLAESDDARREQRRMDLDEPYRTVLGHFRHEVGHYYEPILVDDTGHRDGFRALFGDETASYQEAMDRHYADGPAPDWAERHVSAYATMHPWEDWAETFAHYLHIRDTLQTAAEHGMLIAGPPASVSRPGTGADADASLIAAPNADGYDGPGGFDQVMRDWLPLVYALNAVNRSIGRDDLYPFVLAPAVIEKLAWVHARVGEVSTHA